MISYNHELKRVCQRNRTRGSSESCLAPQISCGLRNRQLSTSSWDDLQLGNGFEEFEALAESIALAG